MCDNNAVYNKSGLSLEYSEAGLGSGITKCIDKWTEAKTVITL